VTIADDALRACPELSAPGCEHSSADICVSWDYPMITVDGVERQIAGWCQQCGALRVWVDGTDEERWLLPRRGGARG